jgi:hypothetical protein
MSDAKHDGKQGAKKPWEDGGKKTWTPRTTPSNAPKGVPMLRCRQSNLCPTKYGNLGKLIKMGQYYKDMMPVKGDYVLTQDPDDDKILFVDALKGWSKAQQDMKLKLPMLNALIWAYLSPESMDEVKNEASYLTYSVDKDLESLQKAIVAMYGVNIV